jgi:hypothetical protein
MSKSIKKYLSIIIFLFNGITTRNNKTTVNKNHNGNLKKSTQVAVEEFPAVEKAIDKMPLNTNDHSFEEYHNIFMQIIWHSFVEALSYKINKKSFFFSKTTNQDIKDKVSKYLPSSMIIIDDLKLPYGLINPEPLNQLIPNIELKFEDFTNFYLYVLNNIADYDDILDNLDIEKLYKGEIPQEIFLKLQLLAKKLAMQFVINYINSCIFVRLGAVDGSDTVTEQSVLKNKIEIIKNNFSFAYCLHQLLNFIIKNNSTIIEESKKSIHGIYSIKILKDNVPKSNIIQKINTLKNKSSHNAKSQYNYNIFDLSKMMEKDFPNKLVTVDYKTISEKEFKDYLDFLNKKDFPEDVNNNFFIVEINSELYIMPRYNPLNEFKEGVLNDRFSKEEEAVEYGQYVLAQEILDNNIMNNLLTNKGKIQIQTEEKNEKKIFDLELQSFFKFLGAFGAHDGSLTAKQKSENATFSTLRIFTQIALIEAVNILKARQTLIGQADSHLAHWSKAKIVIDPILVEGISNPNNKIPTKPIVISFSKMVYTIIEYLESNILGFIENIEDVLNDIMGNEKKQEELSLLISEVLIKNIIIHELKNAYIFSLYSMEVPEAIDKKYLEKLQKIAFNTNLNMEYIKRLQNNKRSLLQAEVERNRQVIYSLQVQCSNKEIKDSFIGIINQSIKEMPNENNVNNLRNELASKQVTLKGCSEIVHLSFSNLPVKIQEEYLNFIQNNSGDNFYIGIYEYFKEINSGNQYILYILPRYDIRDVNKKPGFFEKDINEVELSVLYNKEIHPYLLEIYKSNHDTIVYLASLKFTNDGSKNTKTEFQRYGTTYSKLTGMLNYEIINPAHHYFRFSGSNKKILSKEESSSIQENTSKTLNESPTFFLSKEDILLISELPFKQKKSQIQNFLKKNKNVEDKSKFFQLNKNDIKGLLDLKTREEYNNFIAKLEIPQLS